MAGSTSTSTRMCRVGTMNVVLVVVLLLLGMAPSLASTNRLRAGQGANELEMRHQAAARSLISTRDPQCTMPTADPCTLNTTAIGMIESGSATFYDDTCEEGIFNGCYTDGIGACRTCYLSTDMYMAATNTTATSRPNWVTCPCCVTTTLKTSHEDIEVLAFDFSVFNVSESECTDAPTTAPSIAPTRDPAVPTPSPTLGPMSDTPGPVSTPAPADSATPGSTPTLTDSSTSATEGGSGSGSEGSSAGDRGLGSPAPTDATAMASATPAPSTTDGTANEASTEANEDSDGGSNSLSTGATIGIGVGAAVGVIIIAAVCFRALKGSGSS